MDRQKTYDAGVSGDEGLRCARCGEPLVLSPVTFTYLGHAFPVELPACEACGLVFVPEELAKGRILHVERSIEDK